MTQQAHQSELGWHMTADAADIADILTEFANELRRGDVVVWKDQRELHIDATGKIQMSVRADEKDGGGGLSIDMHWERKS
jgi:amphi-Trp domain-containing protein